MARPHNNKIGHKQVPTKVKAYIDEDIKELVELLNNFEDLYTISSCQGTDRKYPAHIYIIHSLGQNDKLYSKDKIVGSGKLAEFAQRLFYAVHQYVYIDNLQNKKLVNEYPGLLGEIKISIKWFADSLNSGEDWFPGELIIEFPYHRIKQVTEIVRKLHNEIKEVD